VGCLFAEAHGSSRTPPKRETTMQLSTDLPYGSKAIREHIDSGAKFSMNVSPEADAAFMRELQREDSQRYDRLMKNIQTAAIRSNRSVKHRSHQAESMRAKAGAEDNVPQAA
jgi:hypothetical protein